jgi:tetraacyldisaccharide 4'-kinase
VCSHFVVKKPRTMNYQQSHRGLISGQKAGAGARLMRFLLGFAACPYSSVVGLRNLLYSKGWLRAHRVDAAVISIGNITTGGTGKTPLVVWLYNLITQNSKLKAQNYDCAILTRGYKAIRKSKVKSQDYQDEVAILTECCPQAKVIVNPDRVAGAAEAIIKFDAKVLIMDDGFQHRRLARDLDIVTIDATEPFGYGRMLPAGLLREPVTSLKRADAVVITRCDQITELELTELEENLRAVNSDMTIARSMHAPLGAKSADNKEISIEQLKGKKVFAFCGIGNPDAFLDTIKAMGCELAGSEVYDDHYRYTEKCLANISEQAQGLGADLILTTQKDWTKVVSDFRPQILDSQSSPPFACLAIEIRFLAGEDKLTALIKETLAGKISEGS